MLDLVRICMLFGMIVVGLGACSNPLPPPEPEYMIKTSLIGVTQEGFEEELDSKRAAYSFDLNQNPSDYNQLVLDLVASFSQELVLLSGAKEKGIVIEEAELLKAEKFFREDYPEESFEKMLLENAISYLFWKKKVEKNLIIDRFIQQELMDKIEITAEDLLSFYTQYKKEEKEPSDKATDEKKLLSLLRQEKSQNLYDDWIMELKKIYPVEVNEKILERFLMKITKEQKGKPNDE